MTAVQSNLLENRQEMNSGMPDGVDHEGVRDETEHIGKPFCQTKQMY
jgi:hypothetical protein